MQNIAWNLKQIDSDGEFLNGKNAFLFGSAAPEAITDDEVCYRICERKCCLLDRKKWLFFI